MCTFEVLCEPMGKCLAFYLPSHSTFPLTCSCFLLCFAYQVGFPPFITSQDDPLHLWLVVISCKDSFFCCSHGEEWIASHDVVWNAFASNVRDAWFHMSRPMSFHPFLLIFWSMGWHHVINWRHLHFGECDDCWPHLSKLGFLNCFILRGSCDAGSQSKGRTLPQLTSDKHVFPPCHRGFWVSTPTRRWFFPLMC
jgi:hypothetical protein